MNCENFYVQSSLEATYLNVRLEEPMRLDEIAMKVINSDCPEFLLPFRLTTMNDTVTLKYKQVNTVALAYANMTHSKDSFVRFYMNLITPFVKGSDWFLDYHNICVDPRYVYVDNRLGKIYYVYIPEYSMRSTDEEILNFFKNVFTNTNITDDKDFQVRLYRYFNSLNITIMGLYQIFQEEMAGLSPAAKEPVKETKEIPKAPELSDPAPDFGGRSFGGSFGGGNSKDAEEAAQKKAESGKGGFFGGFGKKKEEEPKKEEKKKSNNIFGDEEEDILNGIGVDDFDFFDDSKKKKKEEKPVKERSIKEKPVKEKEPVKGGFFGGFGKKKEEEPVKESFDYAKVQKGKGTGNNESVNMFQPDYLSDETDISEGSNTYGGAALELVDSELPGAMRRIPLDFVGNYVTIGRTSSDQIKPDIAFPADFKRIGRQHARIERSNGALYLIDLGSVNHTFINGDVLAPNQPYKLMNGMEITFSNTKSVIYRVRM